MIAALILLAVPWVWAISPALIVAPLFPVAYLAWRFSGENLRVALLAGDHCRLDDSRAESSSLLPRRTPSRT